MTPSEARDYIIRHCNPDYPHGKTEWETAINMAIDALEKQVPLKTGPNELGISAGNPVITPCGYCGMELMDQMWKYCPWCGQRIKR